MESMEKIRERWKATQNCWQQFAEKFLVRKGNFLFKGGDEKIFNVATIDKVIGRYASLREIEEDKDFIAAAKAQYGKASRAEKLVFSHALFAYKLIVKVKNADGKMEFVNCLGLGDFVKDKDVYWNGYTITGQWAYKCGVSVGFILNAFKLLAGKGRISLVENANKVIRDFCEKDYNKKSPKDKQVANALLWYVAGDEYEPILSQSDKEAIVNCPVFMNLIKDDPAFSADMLKGALEQNKVIGLIRKVFGKKIGREKFDFYDEDVEGLWKREKKLSAAQNERDFKKWMKEIKRHADNSIKTYATKLKHKLSEIAKEIDLIDGSLFDVAKEDEFEKVREKLEASAQFEKIGKGSRQNCADALRHYSEYLSYGENVQKKGDDKMKKPEETPALNQIFYGPPGTGKTYGVVKAALEIIDGEVSDAREEQMGRFNELRETKQIAMVTFHQNFSYEDFIEGIKPVLEEDNKDKAEEKSTNKAKENNLSYRLEDGIFKEIAKNANENKEKGKKYVLIIDEINRGNISAIFGELITLLEDDKRLGQENALSLVLPYSKKPFGVPDNLHVIGTMNTADRSIALLDTALRRRFHFVERMPDLEKLRTENVKGVSLHDLLKGINERIREAHGREYQIGHAYFMEVKSIGDLKKVFERKIIPLLQEYFHDDWKKIAKVVNNSELVKPDGEVKSFGKEGEKSAWDEAANYQKISKKEESQ